MKFKRDFITNSSSTSLIILSKKEITKDTEIKFKIEDLCHVQKFNPEVKSYVDSKIKDMIGEQIKQEDIDNIYILEFYDGNDYQSDIAHNLEVTIIDTIET